MKRLSKMALLKFISSIYSEKLKNFNHHNSSPLFLIAYEVFLQKYGLKSVSENKYYQVIHFFNKFLGEIAFGDSFILQNASKS